MSTTRKAPSKSATLFESGTIKKGNDGNKWVIVTNKRGTHRWQKMTGSKNNVTKKIKHDGNDRTHRKKSKRVLEMEADPNTVWGKNKPLENFWQSLASGKYVVVIYKNGKHKYVKPPNALTQKSTNFYNNLDDDKEIEAVLSSNLSQDAYEVYLYPKAKDNSVEYVIKNYKKYFKSMGAPSKELVKSGRSLMKKVRVPG
jgi:hypothetical protein